MGRPPRYQRNAVNFKSAEGEPSTSWLWGLRFFEAVNLVKGKGDRFRLCSHTGRRRRVSYGPVLLLDEADADADMKFTPGGYYLFCFSRAPKQTGTAANVTKMLDFRALQYAFEAVIEMKYTWGVTHESASKEFYIPKEALHALKLKTAGISLVRMSEGGFNLSYSSRRKMREVPAEDDLVAMALYLVNTLHWTRAAEPPEDTAMGLYFKPASPTISIVYASDGGSCTAQIQSLNNYWFLRSASGDFYGARQPALFRELVDKLKRRISTLP